MINGQTLIDMGFEPGPWFAQAISKANELGLEGDELRDMAAKIAPPVYEKVPLKNQGAFTSYLLPDGSGADLDNIKATEKTMAVVTRTPTIVDAYLMPDACPAGPVGTIPVGGVVAAKNAIHPGMHSADICCSVMLTNFGDVDPKTVLDAAHKVTHFGPGGRSRADEFPKPEALLEAFAANPFLNKPRTLKTCRDQLGTQGDGNHFLFIGKSKNTSDVCMVTHHGSRGPGALLYKEGMNLAEKFRSKISPQTLRQNAWIPFDTDEGQAYWAALQLVREWTKLNHELLHDATLEAVGATSKDRFWNEHNFVFRDTDEQGNPTDVFWHAKGSTPMDPSLSPDTDGRMLVPLNMAEPVLVVGKAEMRFAPHGAGRNYSRTQHKRMSNGTDAEIFERETDGLDVRFYSNHIDISELPSAYKNADRVKSEIVEHKLANVIDEIHPYGCIMAGDWEVEAPWRKKKDAKRAAAARLAEKEAKRR